MDGWKTMKWRVVELPMFRGYRLSNVETEDGEVIVPAAMSYLAEHIVWEHNTLNAKVVDVGMGFKSPIEIEVVDISYELGQPPLVTLEVYIYGRTEPPFRLKVFGGCVGRVYV